MGARGRGGTVRRSAKKVAAKCGCSVRTVQRHLKNLDAPVVGDSPRDFNRTLLSALRKAEKRTRLRAEWAFGKDAERFFDYVPKGTHKK